MTESYADFLASKRLIDPDTGLTDIPSLPDFLFPFQRDIVTWALKRGRAALFEGTGLGKTAQSLTWLDVIAQHTGKPVLYINPLAVTAQCVRESEKFGIAARQASTADDVSDGINVTNYQKLHHLDMSVFGGVVLGEASILKNESGKYRSDLIEACRHIPFRLLETATPAPNDYMELGNHAEFLGVMTYTDMLATFFTHDGGDTAKWVLKGHAKEAFWKWMASWAVMLRRPSDLGYEDSGYDLPPLTYHMHDVEIKPTLADGDLFESIEVAQTLKDRQVAKRNSIDERAALAASLVPDDKPVVIWCHLNDEAAALCKVLPDAINLHGSLKDDEKVRIILDFCEGRIKRLVTKPAILSAGVNAQVCADTIFIGLSDSFEQLFQAVRRFWRFGQTNPVNVHIISASSEGATLANIRRKEAAFEAMADALVAHTKDLTKRAVRGTAREIATYEANKKMEVPSWL
jgi:hypothetical protein